jgi:hypothetical protein
MPSKDICRAALKDKGFHGYIEWMRKNITDNLKSIEIQLNTYMSVLEEMRIIPGKCGNEDPDCCGFYKESSCNGCDIFDPL